MGSMIKTKKGFTLVELVIVIVIVGILSIVSVPIYRGYVEKAMMTEGKVLLSAIAKAELAYHVQKGYFLSVSGSQSSELDIDASTNKYFRSFKTDSGSSAYYSNSMVLGAVVQKDMYYDENECVDIYVYGNNNNSSWTLHAKQWANGGLRGDNDDIDVWRNSNGSVVAEEER